MTSRIRFDRKLCQFRDKKTGRFLHAQGVHRIRVSDGVLFVFDEPETPEPFTPTPEAIARWGEFA